ncbi:unnamed protein product [Cladocopium goreaui]|uniref:Retrovirus-related Pol polyprotein from transposon TNT 1-94 n=1 Tax=Cladocopium goreaui TaxID=2562237 RepID=A0A9P1FE69_9DINO|nr:unnamed protein product [Cladocopium goreaui]
MMSRSLSVPSSSRDHAAADGTGTNPFYSERLQQEIALHERRPKHLPADDEGRVPPVQDGRVLQHCMALCLVMEHFKLGLCTARFLVKERFMIGRCMALFLVMELFKVGLCMARFLVMEHFLIGLCMVVLRRSLGFKILFNKGILFKEHKGMELWVSHQCRHLGKLLEEVAVEKPNYLCRNFELAEVLFYNVYKCEHTGDVEITMQLQQTTKRLSSKLQLERVMMVELQAQQLIKLPPVQALMVQDWVLRVDVELHNGCPYVAHEFGAKLLTVLEQHQIQQELKKMTLKSILTRGAAGLGNNMSIEMAMLVKLKEVMPTLPEDLALKLVPDLSVLTDPNIGLNLPWNRRKRKRLMMAKNVIIHMYSGPDASYWERRLSNEHTEVLCVDLEASTPSNALDETTFAFLLSLCASKRVKALLGGPPCRTTSALRFQKDDGPPILRTEDHPYGLPSLTPQQAELVTNDSILWLRLMLMYILCEEVRPKEQAQTAFLCEQPQDPAEYRKKEDVDEHQYFSMWRTQEWKSFQEAYNAKLISFDQGLQLLKQSADGFAVKRLHVKDLKILLALFTPKTMSDLLVKITLCLALMILSSLVILKNNNLEMVNHLNNMLNEINNKRAMKLNMNKVFLQVLHKMNLILSKKNRPEDPEVRAAQVRSHGNRERVHAGAASAMSFLVGQALLSEAEALEIKGEQDEADPLWIAAVVLMILGAIYAGKLAVQAGQCCMRRLQVWSSASSLSGADPLAAAAAGPVQASSSGGADRFADVPGLEQALAAVAQISAADGGIEHALMQRAGEVSEALRVGAESKATLHNPWSAKSRRTRMR